MKIRTKWKAAPKTATNCRLDVVGEKKCGALDIQDSFKRPFEPFKITIITVWGRVRRGEVENECNRVTLDIILPCLCHQTLGRNSSRGIVSEKQIFINVRSKWEDEIEDAVDVLSPKKFFFFFGSNRSIIRKWARPCWVKKGTKEKVKFRDEISRTAGSVLHLCKGLCVCAYFFLTNELSFV